MRISQSQPLLTTLLTLLTLLTTASAQFQFFEQMFGGGGGGGEQHHGGHGGGGGGNDGNAPSDSAWYRGRWESVPCNNYICPSTLACVHFPHHCPCAFPDVEDKVELSEGSAICVSKGGWREGEAGRKVELARKGLL